MWYFVLQTNVTILINNKAIDEEKYVKYLGVLINNDLSFKFHIDELVKKISRAIGVLYTLRPFVSNNVLIEVYYAIVYPFLLYGVILVQLFLEVFISYRKNWLYGYSTGIGRPNMLIVLS